MNKFVLYYIDDDIDSRLSAVFTDYEERWIPEELGKSLGIDEFVYNEKQVKSKKDFTNYITNEFYDKHSEANLILLDYKLYSNDSTTEKFTGAQVYKLLKKLSGAEIYIVTSEEKNLDEKYTLEKAISNYVSYIIKTDILDINDQEQFSEKFKDIINKIKEQQGFEDYILGLSKALVEENIDDDDKKKTIIDTLDNTEFAGLSDKKIDDLINEVHMLLEEVGVKNSVQQAGE